MIRCRYVLLVYYTLLVSGTVVVCVTRFSLSTILAVCAAVLLFVVPLLVYNALGSRRRSAAAANIPRVAPTHQPTTHHTLHLPILPSDDYLLLAKPWRAYTHCELALATNNFSEKNILGSGGQATVFRGVEAADDGESALGRSIAVKRFYHVSSNSIKQERADSQFRREVQALSRASHRNVVEFYGYCIHGHERLLVYELVVNGSLHDCLFAPLQDPRRRALNWRQRLAIAQDAAHGLDYLHNHCIVNLLHLDIKPQNILLDEMLNAKIADFGLSKLIGRGESGISKFRKVDESKLRQLTQFGGNPGYMPPELDMSLQAVSPEFGGNPDESGLRQRTQFGGTPGYMPPELDMSFQAQISIITKKADVYSFGVVLLQIVSGRPLSNAPTVETQPGLSFRDAASYLVSIRDLKPLLDAGLMDADDSWVGVKMAEVGARCVEMSPTNRPTIKQVSEMLANISPM